MREGYRLFQEHDSAFMERYEPDAKFRLPTSLPAGGTYDSPWEALEFLTTVSERLDDPRPEPEEFIRDGNRVVAICTWHAVVPSTGREATARVAHVFTFPDADRPLWEQKATAFEFIGDTAVFNAALAEADSG